MTMITKKAAVVIRGGLLLVVRKCGTSIFISPGGKPEPGESAQQTLARELREETGLRLRSCTAFGSFCDRSALEGAMVEIETFLVTADGMAVPSAEIAEVGWIDSGYREDGLRLGSVFDRFVIPALLASGRLRERRRPARSGPGGLAVVADVDGSLVFAEAPPDPAVAAVLSEFADRRDIHLVFATSRAQRGVRELFGTLADRVDLICCNGAIVVHDGIPRRRAGLPATVLEPVIDVLRDEKVGFYLEYGDRFIVSGGRLGWMDYPDRVRLAADECPSTDGVVKLVVDGSDQVARLRALTGPDVELYEHASGVVDVMPAGVSKAAALAELPGISERLIVALGDDINDQEVLGQADFAAVVGEGLPGLERAKHIRRVPAADAEVAGTLRELVRLAEAQRSGA